METKALATHNLIRGRVVNQGGHRGNGRGIVLSTSGTYDPASERDLGGIILSRGPRAECDVVWPNGEHAHVSHGMSQGQLYRLPYSVTDSMATEEQITEALEAVKAAELERKRAEDQAAADKAALREHCILNFSWLTRTNSQTRSHVLAAKNIKCELARAFPGIKFSVCSDSYSMGNSVDVRWDLGPTDQQVQHIVSKYQEGHFDGMEDIYNYDSINPWPDLFGGSKYVHTHRCIEPEIVIVAGALCDEWKLARPADGRSFWNVEGPGGNGCAGNDVGTIAARILARCSFPPGAVVTGLERCTDANSGPGFECYFRPTFTAPAAAVAAAAEQAAAVGAFEGKPAVSFNAEKFGLELRFPAKPAAAVLDTLKRHGWRWSRFGGCWYQRASEEALNAAAQAAGLTAEQVEILRGQIDGEGHRRGAQGMEIACGIA